MAQQGNARDEWGRRYERIRPSYVAFTAALKALLGTLLREHPVDVTQLEARTKTVKSFIDKIGRKGYDDPLKQTTDFTGLRIVVYDPADCVLVGKVIESSFDIDDKNSSTALIADDPERFGYRSDHYQVSLTDDRCEMPEWSKFGGLCAEIQVRTVMQHAWAAVDHKIGYKREGLPPEIRHRLSRLSALLELADREFEEALAESRERTSQHAESIAEGRLGAGIDSLSLTAFLAKTGIGRRWSKRAVELNYLAPRSEDLDVTALVGATRAVGLHTLEDLGDMLSDLDSWGDDVLEAVLDATLAGWPPDHLYAGITAYDDQVLTLLLLVAAGDPEAVEACSLRDDIKDGVLHVIGSTRYPSDEGAQGPG